MHHSLPDFSLTLTDPMIVAGIFLGAMMPFMFAALTMGAVSRAAHAMVEEVRRQFREIRASWSTRPARVRQVRRHLHHLRAA